MLSLFSEHCVSLALQTFKLFVTQVPPFPPLTTAPGSVVNIRVVWEAASLMNDRDLFQRIL